MKKIGLTGNIGSGKSWICALFETRGIPVFYSDEEAKRLYLRDDIRQQMQARFGEEIYFPDGHLDKVAMARRIFANPTDRDFVEQTLYPALNRYFNEWAEQQDAPYVLYESALIFEKGIASLFDAVIMVTASEATRLRRVVQREHCSEEAVVSRMKAQWTEAEKISRADYVIYHEHDDEDDLLMQQIAVIDSALREG